MTACMIEWPTATLAICTTSPRQTAYIISTVHMRMGAMWCTCVSIVLMTSCHQAMCYVLCKMMSFVHIGVVVASLHLSCFFILITSCGVLETLHFCLLAKNLWHTACMFETVGRLISTTSHCDTRPLIYGTRTYGVNELGWLAWLV